MFVGQADKDAPEVLLGGLDISIKGMGQKQPPGMDAVSREGQYVKGATLNEGGF